MLLVLFIQYMYSVSGCHLMVGIYLFARSESWVQIPEKSMMVAGRASNLNSLQQSLPVNQGVNFTTTEINNMEYKRKKINLHCTHWPLNRYTHTHTVVCIFISYPRHVGLGYSLDSVFPPRFSSSSR